MAVIFNATAEEVHTQAHGNWFHFKPKQIKIMGDALGQFLAEKRAEDGLVELPAAFEDLAYRESIEGKEVLLAAERKGIEKFLAKLLETVRNNTISLSRDLKMKNIQTDPREFMSDGEMRALELLAKYRATGEDEAQKRVLHARDLEKKLGIK